MVQIQELTATDWQLWALLIGATTVYAGVTGLLKKGWNWLTSKLRRNK